MVPPIDLSQTSPRLTPSTAQVATLEAVLDDLEADAAELSTGSPSVASQNNPEGVPLQWWHHLGGRLHDPYPGRHRRKHAHIPLLQWWRYLGGREPRTAAMMDISAWQHLGGKLETDAEAAALTPWRFLGGRETSFVANPPPAVWLPKPILAASPADVFQGGPVIRKKTELGYSRQRQLMDGRHVLLYFGAWSPPCETFNPQLYVCQHNHPVPPLQLPHMLRQCPPTQVCLLLQHAVGGEAQRRDRVCQL